MAAKKKLKITLVRSKFGRKPRHLDCIRGLGLRHINDTVTLEDNVCVRGMVEKVAYLLKVEEV